MRKGYFWGKAGEPPQKVELPEDTDKQPEIPTASKVIKKFKDAVDRAHQKRRKILKRWRRDGQGN